MKAVQLLLDGGEEAISRKDTSREEFIAARLMESSTGEIRLMESICERENTLNALKRVERNGGAPGIDKMKVGRLRGFLRRTWETVETALQNGTYKPLPVRRKEIPKPDGGIRLLGIRFWTVSFNSASHRYCKRSGNIPSRRGRMATARAGPRLRQLNSSESTSRQDIPTWSVWTCRSSSIA
jgi:hypothetical protein